MYTTYVSNEFGANNLIKKPDIYIYIFQNMTTYKAIV